MKAPGSIVILAEDQSGARFVEAFLRNRGATSRAIRTRVAPEGRGSGKQWVTTQYPVEVTEHRRRAPHTWKALIVCTDADELSVNDRLEQLARALEQNRNDRDEPDPIEPRRPSERIVLLVPRWEIETWALHLNTGEAVIEDEQVTAWDPNRSRAECRAAGECWDAHRPPTGPMPHCCPPSLIRADSERARLDEG